MHKFSQKDWDTCINILQTVSEDTNLIKDEHRLKALITKIHKEGKRLKKQTIREEAKQQDQAAVSNTGRVLLERNLSTLDASIPTTATPPRRNKPSNCYVCKQSYHDLDTFYHLLCPACAAINHEKREQRTDLTDHVAIVTGGRIKIGYELVLKLLRDGAEVLATTRFPIDALERVSKEPDFDDFKARIHYVSLDLRHLPSVEQFIEYVKSQYSHIDILINNAAQTIRRPANFYAELYEKEGPLHELAQPLQKQLVSLSENSNISSQLEWVDDVYFPKGELDRFLQPIDARPENSWVTTLSEVSSVEFIEAQVINYFSPYLLTSQLKNTLETSPNNERFVVNVSAMEGQFARETKTHFHPHTNMAKAALNMMTRTSAEDYARSNIYMNSVDTGWITQENPYPKAQHLYGNGFVPPLDEIDGAARIYDPIVRGIGGEFLYGHFLKDYSPYAW